MMNNMDYRQDNSHHTLFIKQVGQKINILLVCVDDMMIISDDRNEITRLKKKLP